jgi:hypothetical protein
MNVARRRSQINLQPVPFHDFDSASGQKICPEKATWEFGMRGPAVVSLWRGKHVRALKAATRRRNPRRWREFR